MAGVADHLHQANRRSRGVRGELEEAAGEPSDRVDLEAFPKQGEVDQVGKGDRHLVRSRQPALGKLPFGDHRLPDRLPQVPVVHVPEGLAEQR
jgi:hypothetical protein